MRLRMMWLNSVFNYCLQTVYILPSSHWCTLSLPGLYLVLFFCFWLGTFLCAPGHWVQVLPLLEIFHDHHYLPHNDCYPTVQECFSTFLLWHLLYFSVAMLILSSLPLHSDQGFPWPRYIYSWWKYGWIKHKWTKWRRSLWAFVSQEASHTLKQVSLGSKYGAGSKRAGISTRAGILVFFVHYFIPMSSHSTLYTAGIQR